MWLLASEKLAKQKKSILVVGLGYFGAEVAVRLAELGQEVVGVDKDQSIILHIADKLTQAVELDATDPDLLTTLGVGNFDICIVGRGSNLEDSVSITMNLKELGAKCLIAKAVSDRQARILDRLGVDMIVFPELDMARQLADNLVHPKVVGEIEIADGYIVEAVRSLSRFTGSPYKNVLEGLPKGTEVLAIYRDNHLHKTPPLDMVMKEHDILVIAGRRSRLVNVER